MDDEFDVEVTIKVHRVRGRNAVEVLQRVCDELRQRGVDFTGGTVDEVRSRPSPPLATLSVDPDHS